MPLRLPPLVRISLCALGLVCALAMVDATVLGALGVSARLHHKPFGTEAADFFANDTNRLVISIFVYPFALICLIACRHVLDRRSFGSLGLRPPRAFPELGRGVLCGALAVSLLFGVQWLTGGILLGGPSPEAFEGGAFTSASLLIVCAALFLCVGFTTEAIFRGYLLHNLDAALGWFWAVVVQALVFVALRPLDLLGSSQSTFGAFWSSPFPAANTFLLAVAFALCYRKTGSLWFPVGFHSAWLFFLGSAWALPVTGAQPFRLLDVSAGPNDLLSGGAFGSEGSLLLTPLLGLLIYLLAALPDHPQALLDLALASEPAGASAETTPTTAGGAEEAGLEEPEEERGPNRFKTSMRPVSVVPEMDPAIFRTIPSLSTPRVAFTPGQADGTEILLQPDVLTGDIGERIALHTGLAAPLESTSDEIESSVNGNAAGTATAQPIEAAAIPPAAATSSLSTPPAAAPSQAPPPAPEETAETLTTPAIPRPKPKAPRW